MIAPNTQSRHGAPETPLTILMTTDTVGGVWSYSLQLAGALRDHHIRVVLATEGPKMSEPQRRAAEELGLAVHECGYRLEWMPGAWDDVSRAGQWLTDLAATVRPDVVHLNSYSHGVCEFGVPKLVAGHSCVFSWHESVRHTKPAAEWNRYLDSVTRGLAGADMVVAPSAAMMHALERWYGRLHKKRVIHNGRDPQVFKPGVKEPMVFSAGRFWDEAKNIRALDAAAQSLLWPVFVAGNGGKDWHNVQSLGLLDQKDMARWLGAASVFALPARYEPFGLSALEAGLSGCALVLGDIPSLREVWGDAADYVDPEDHDGLVTALERLMRDEKRRERMAARATERALRYTHTQMAEQYAQVYRQLALLAGRPAAMPALDRAVGQVA